MQSRPCYPVHASQTTKETSTPGLTTSHSLPRDSIDSKALVRRDNRSIDDLLIGIGREGNQLLRAISHGPGSEARIVTELAAPARSNSVHSAGDWAGRRAADGSGAGDSVGAGSDGGEVGVDAEGDSAGSVGSVAGALERGDGPVCGASLDGGGGGDGGGREKGEEGGGGVLHFCGGKVVLVLNVDVDC